MANLEAVKSVTENYAMHMYFYTGNNISCFLFEGWNTDGKATGVLLICVAVLAVCVLVDALKTFLIYLQVKSGQNPLTSSKTMDSIQDRSPLLLSLRIPANMTEIKRRRFKFHITETLVHVLNTVLGYMIMLAVMSYSIWVGLSVILGSAVSYYIFGAIRASVQSQSSKRTVHDVLHPPDTHVAALSGNILS